MQSVDFNNERIEFYEAGSARFGKVLRESFLPNTTEYVHLRKWFLREILSNIRDKSNKIFLEIGPGDGTSLTNELKEFHLGVGIEPTTILHEILRTNAPNMKIIGGRFENIGDNQILDAINAVHKETSLDNAFDLAMRIHTDYYFSKSLALEHLVRLSRLVKPGGSIVTVLQSRESQFAEMYRYFIGDAYHLEETIERFCAFHPNWAIKSSSIDGTVTLTDEDTAIEVSGFMLCYVPAKMPLKSELRNWVRKNFYIAPNKYVIQNAQRAVVLTKPLTPSYR